MYNNYKKWLNGIQVLAAISKVEEISVVSAISEVEEISVVSAKVISALENTINQNQTKKSKKYFFSFIIVRNNATVQRSYLLRCVLRGLCKRFLREPP